MTNDQMQEHLRGLGLKKTYRPEWDAESKTILLATRRPATIVEGRLAGCEIALRDSTFRIWTGQKQKARKYAAANGLKVRLWDGEAELWVPANLADSLLPLFGAKTRRELKPEQKEALKRRLEQARNSPNFKKNLQRNGVAELQNPQKAGSPS